ncbi:MAG: tetratricopeptide repeat protein [Bacteroidetes bacterium]|nr:tetratricopeptide repeat protein [Bacteroidota bacterium]
MRQRAILLLVLIFWLNSFLCAQVPSALDSLLKRYHSDIPRDTNFVTLLNTLSRTYRLKSADTAIYFGKQAYELAEKLSFEKGVATALNFIGVGYFYKGDYKTDLSFQQKALDYARERHYETQMANALNSLALAYQYQGNNSLALEFYLKSLQNEERRHDVNGQVKVLANLSIFWKRQGNYERAIDYSEQALHLKDSAQLPQATRAGIVNTLGTCYIELKKFEKALVYLKQSLELNQRMHQTLYVINSMSNIGYCYLQMGKPDQARHYFLEALNMTEKVDAPLERTLTLLDLAEVYVEEKKPQEALVLAKQGFALAKKINQKENILTAYRELATIYQALGNTSMAYSYLHQAMTLNDSLRSADITRKVVELQKSYELEKKETEISLLAKDAALKTAELNQERSLRYGLLFLVGGLCVAVFTVYYAFSVKTSLNRKLQTQNDEILEQKKLIEDINISLRNQALRAQMNPHFIFNALNSIQFLIFSQDNEKALHYLSKFARLLRKILDHSRQELIPLSAEIETIEYYVQLEALRFNEGFDFTITTNFPEEEQNKWSVPPMIVQPFIENAIIHGLMPKKEDRKLGVTYYREEDFIVCEVTDNGIGRKAAEEIKNQKQHIHQSKGMQFTYDRLKVLNNQSSGRAHVEVVDLENEEHFPAGTKVKIYFPTTPHV